MAKKKETTSADVADVSVKETKAASPRIHLPKYFLKRDFDSLQKAFIRSEYGTEVLHTVEEWDDLCKKALTRSLH